MSPQTQYRIILFYVFTPLADPEAVRLWQFTLAQSLGLRGRVILSEHGINATLGGELGAIKRDWCALEEPNSTPSGTITAARPPVFSRRRKRARNSSSVFFVFTTCWRSLLVDS